MATTLSDIQPLLVPVVSGLITAVGLEVKDVREHHDARRLRDETLADARDEVAFVSEWWQAQQLIAGGASPEATEKARRWLEAAEEKVMSTAELKETPRRRVTFNRLLLLRPMHGFWARTLRALYLIDVVWVVLGAAVSASDGASKSTRNQIVGDIGFLIFCAVVGLLLRALAVNADKNNRIASAHPAQSPQSVAESAVVAHTAQRNGGEAEPVGVPGTLTVTG